MNKILFKIDRVAAWVLFIGVLMYFITGYGMTKGIISPEFSHKAHLTLLTYIILLAFLVHASFAIHLAFKRWKIWNIFTQIFLVIFLAAFCGFIIYADQFYSRQPKVEEPADEEIIIQNMNENINIKAEEEEIKKFTIEELAEYDGQDGQPAYTAIDGEVYDLTGVFPNGKHYFHFAGKDLSEAFYSYHVKQELSGYSIVGKLID